MLKKLLSVLLKQRERLMLIGLVILLLKITNQIEWNWILSLSPLLLGLLAYTILGISLIRSIKKAKLKAKKMESFFDNIPLK